jgi:hypothetical protein
MPNLVKPPEPCKQDQKLKLVLLMLDAMALLVLAFGFVVSWLAWGERPFDPNGGDRETRPDGTRSNRWLDR